MLEQQPLLCASVIAAQATVAGSEGFRQRDVRFFVELFSNWLESTTGEWALTVHNVQVQRHLDVLPKVGWAKRVTRKPPRYRLTPEGLVGLLRRLGARRNLMRLDEFFLVFHFFDAYGSRLKAMVERSGPLASGALAVDVDELTDPEALVHRERAMIKRQIERLTARSAESRKMSDIARSRLGRGEPLPNVIAILEKEYAYELNSQRPLSELLAQMPEAWRRAELEDAALRRARGLWKATRDLLVAYDEIVAGLLADRRAARIPKA